MNASHAKWWTQLKWTHLNGKKQRQRNDFNSLSNRAFSKFPEPTFYHHRTPPSNDLRRRTQLTSASDLHWPPPATSNYLRHRHPPTSASNLHRPPPPTSTDLHHRPPTTSATDLHQPPPVTSTDLCQRPPPTSASDLHGHPPVTSTDFRQRPPPTSATNLLHRRSPTNSTDLLHRPQPTFVTDLHRAPPLTSASNLRRRPPPPTSAPDLRHQFHPKDVIAQILTQEYWATFQASFRSSCQSWSQTHVGGRWLELIAHHLHVFHLLIRVPRIHKTCNRDKIRNLNCDFST